MNPEIVVGFYALVGTAIAALAAFFGGVLRNRSERRVASTNAAQADLAARRAKEPGRDIDERGFAGAVRTDQAHNLAGFDPQ